VAISKSHRAGNRKGTGSDDRHALGLRWCAETPRRCRRLTRSSNRSGWQRYHRNAPRGFTHESGLWNPALRAIPVPTMGPKISKDPGRPCQVADSIRRDNRGGRGYQSHATAEPRNPCGLRSRPGHLGRRLPTNPRSADRRFLLWLCRPQASRRAPRRYTKEDSSLNLRWHPFG
jgi:hypothetical protein